MSCIRSCAKPPPEFLSQQLRLMSRIIRERYENGILVERTVEGSNTTLWHWLTLVVHTVIAISLVALVAISIHDSLTMRNTLSQEETSATSCEEQPRFRS